MGESDSCTSRVPGVLVAIDVDSTLHDYWEQFRTAALALHGVDLPYVEQTDWAVDALSRAQLAEVIEHTHDDAQVAAAVPYAGAADVMNGWRRAGHLVLITTHRRPGAHDVTAEWLAEHGIGYDVLRCGYDKVEHCRDVGAHVLIDDSPTNLRLALDAGLTAATIRHPWNHALEVAGHPIVFGDDWLELAARLAARVPELALP
jgi:FMN phosphatase YigB (HAD superfamily)